MIEHYGDIIELDYKLKPDAIDQCKAIEFWEWQEEKSRRYIDLIGDLPKSTEARANRTCPIIVIWIDCPRYETHALFTGVYKAPVQELDAGSYFEPQRLLPGWQTF